SPKQRSRLLALIDGIGFTSNRAGLDGVLSVADEFCQYRTLWKAAVLCSALTKIAIKLELPTAVIKEQHAFLTRFNFLKSVFPKEEGRDAKYRLPAGDGFVLFDEWPSE